MKSMFSKKGLRENQQDRVAALEVDQVVVLGVADGNGGVGGGELAEVALKEAFSYIAWEICQKSTNELEQHIREAIKISAKEVLRQKEVNAEWFEAGTTISLAIITTDYIVVAWVGDSPIYTYDPLTRDLKRVTTPHNLVEQLVQEGTPRESLAGQPGVESILTRCLGHPECEADCIVLPCHSPKRVLVGSDGVFGYLSEQEIINTIERCGVSASHLIPYLLVKQALKNGSDDNASAVTSNIIQNKLPRVIRKTRLYGEMTN